MVLLAAHSLGLVREGRRLFSGLELSLRAKQRVGLIGRSGAGKSSLLALLTGRVAPQEGRVMRVPGLRLSFLPQDWQPPAQATVGQAALEALTPLRALEAEVRAEERRLASGGDEHLAAWTAALARFEAAGGYGGEARLAQTLASLGLSEHLEQPAASLSGGERARLGLALVLSEAPELLLLDEPGQHLDLTMRRWLQRKLARFPGTLLVASHDRALLEAVCSDLLVLEDGTLKAYRGGYRAARAERATEARQSAKARREEQKTLVRLKRQQARFLAWGQGRRRESASEPATLVHAAPAARPLELGASARRHVGEALRAVHLSKTLGGKALVNDASLLLARGDKLALVGPSGSGKSTFLRLLALELASDHPQGEVRWGEGVRARYLDQDARGLDPERSALAQLADEVGGARAAALLASAGLAHARWEVAAGALSAGERARAALALLMASEADLLFLDEPTNHLDLETVERLEAALVAASATVVFVAHDEALVRLVATRVIALEGGELVEFRGGLAGFFRGSRRQEPDLPPLAEPGLVPDETQAETLERLEDELAALEETLMDPLRLSEKSKLRLVTRRRALLDALSLRYDAGLPPPAPRLTRREGAVEVWLAEEAPERALLLSNAGLRLRLFMPAADAGRTGHLALETEEDRCVLPWAKEAALRAAARLAFESLELQLLQVQSADGLGPAGFVAADEGWWLQSRGDFERREGWGQAGGKREGSRQGERAPSRRRKRRARRPAGLGRRPSRGRAS